MYEAEESDYFNPFQIAGGKVNLMRLSVGIAAALSISSSLAYGPLYFFLCCAAYMLRAQQLLAQMGLPSTIRDVIRIMDPRRRHARGFRDTEQIRMSLSLLECYPQLTLDPSAGPDNSIAFDRILEEEATCYFYTLLTGENSVRQIVGLALFCLIQSAIARSRAGLPRRNVFVLIDEMHAVVGETFAETLVMAAKFGIYFIGAVQCLGQLKHRDVEFSEIVLNNSNLELFFTAYTNQEHDYLSFQSKDVMVRFAGGVERGLITEANFHECLQPAVTSNDIRDCSDTKGDAYLIWRDGNGHKNPLRIHCPFYQGEDVHEEPKNKPLPRRALPAPALAPAAPASASPTWDEAPHDPAHVARVAQMEALMLELAAEYGGN